MLETLSNLEIFCVMIEKKILFLYDQSFRTHAGSFRKHFRNLYQSRNFQIHAVNLRTHEKNFEQSRNFVSLDKNSIIFMYNPNFRTHARYFHTHARNV